MGLSEFELRFKVAGAAVSGTLHLPRAVAGKAGKKKGGGVPAVLFCHGFTGTKIEAHFLFVKAARALAQAGFAAYRIDFRGSGESEGRFEDLTPLTEVADARRALKVLAARPEVDAGRLGMIGLSLGGCVTALTTGREPVVRAAALWSAVADPELLWRGRADMEARRSLARRGFIERGAHRVGRRFFESFRRLRPCAELARSTADVLLVHGTADQTVSLEHPWLYERALRERPAGSVESVLVRDADHTFGDPRSEATAIKTTVNWFKRKLGGALKRADERGRS